MEKNNSKASKTEDSETIKKAFLGLFGKIKHFLQDLIDIRPDTDQETTIAQIKEDIPFKGHNSWILICSIFIASIGLNTNSTAVVIGAMLISPLMGPILGMGMSLAINDIDTLRRSVKNFLVMVILSVLTAYLFFEFFQFQDASSELLARTEPDFRDVLIAFFGGLALVIARAKKGTMASVIFGVAIATALMPPLCTVGFGLAIGKWNYAFGAMYLFLINTVLIGLATFLVLKILRFPVVRYVNSRRRRRIGELVSLLGIAIMIPALITFINVYKKSKFMSEAKTLVNNTIGVYQYSSGGRFLKDLTEYYFSKEKDGIQLFNFGKGEVTPSFIEVISMGNDIIPESIINTWQVQKNNYPSLVDAEFRVVQSSKDDSHQKLKYVNELYETKKALLKDKDSEIQLLKQKIADLSRLRETQIPFQDITSEAKINYQQLQEMSFAYTIKTNFSKIDTIPIFYIKWQDSLDINQTNMAYEKISNWLKKRLKNEKIIVLEQNN